MFHTEGCSKSLYWWFWKKNFHFLCLIFYRVLKPPGGMSSNLFSETESTTSSNESRASSTSPKTPQKVYRMASSFELGDDQPENPIPRRKPFKPSGNKHPLIASFHKKSMAKRQWRFFSGKNKFWRFENWMQSYEIRLQIFFHRVNIEMYICWLDSCLVPRKYRNSMQNVQTGLAGSKVSSRPQFCTKASRRRALYQNEIKFTETLNSI